MRIVCISDTHGLHGGLSLPGGDVLVHAGDMTARGRPHEIADFGQWIRSQPHEHKVLIAGNHDFLFESAPAEAHALVKSPSVHYLMDAGIKIAGRRFWGSPWQPWFHDWAFNLERGAPLAARWAQIPRETDILVTHGPPKGVLDRVARDGRQVGCEALRDRLQELDVSLHVFGHIHEDHGVERDSEGRIHVNASTCTLQYRPTQPPIVFDWPATDPRPTRVH